MVAQKRDTFMAFFLVARLILKNIGFRGSKLSVKPITPRISLLGKYTGNPGTLQYLGSKIIVTFPFSQSKNGDTMGNQEVTFLLEKSL